MKKNHSIKFKTKSDTNGLAASLIAIKEVCDKHELFFWLNYGALLGMVREDRLLPWNNDVELSCWADEASNNKIKQITDVLIGMDYNCFYYRSVGTLSIKKGDLIDINLNLYWSSGSFAVRPHETPSKFRWPHLFASIFYWLAVFMYIYPNKFPHSSIKKRFKDRIKIAVMRVFSWFSSGTRESYFNKLLSWSEFFGGTFQQTGIPAAYFSRFTTRKFYGAEMNVPYRSAELLALIYGEDWVIPKDNWSFYDEKNKPHSGIVFINERFNYSQIDMS